MATDERASARGHRRTSPLWWGPLFISPSRSKFQATTATSRLHIAVHSTARYVVNCCPVGTIGGVGWSSVSICGRLCGWYPSAGSAKCNPRVFVEGGPGACLLFLNDPMQCYAIPTKPNTNMQGRCFSCVAGWHGDGRYCNGGCMMVSCGGCCPSVCCFLSTHMCSFWHFVRIPCNVDITTFLSTIYSKLNNGTIRTNIHRN